MKWTEVDGCRDVCREKTVATWWISIQEEKKTVCLREARTIATCMDMVRLEMVRLGAVMVTVGGLYTKVQKWL